LKDATATDAPAFGVEVEKAAVGIFKAQRDAIKKKIPAKADRSEALALLALLALDEQSWESPLADSLAVPLKQYAGNGVAAFWQSIDQPPTKQLSTHEITAIAKRAAAEASPGINETTAIAIRDKMDTVRINIDSMPTDADHSTTVRNGIDEVFDDAITRRAPMIGATEANNAMVTGSLAMAAASGLLVRKFWTLDGNPCPGCVQIAEDYADGLPIGELFESDEFGEVIGPPAHPNCMCVLDYRNSNAEL
jgi:hypothetical protein